jgi:hypothetical protein
MFAKNLKIQQTFKGKLKFKKCLTPISPNWSIRVIETPITWGCTRSRSKTECRAPLKFFAFSSFWNLLYLISGGSLRGSFYGSSVPDGLFGLDLFVLFFLSTLRLLEVFVFIICPMPYHLVELGLFNLGTPA